MERDYVNEALERKRTGAAQYESEEDALLDALENLVEDARAGDLEAHGRGMRGKSMPPLDGEELDQMAGNEEQMPKECIDGTCEHPEHQMAESLPEDI